MWGLPQVSKTKQVCTRDDANMKCFSHTRWDLIERCGSLQVLLTSPVPRPRLASCCFLSQHKLCRAFSCVPARLYAGDEGAVFALNLWHSLPSTRRLLHISNEHVQKFYKTHQKWNKLAPQKHDCCKQAINKTCYNNMIWKKVNKWNIHDCCSSHLCPTKKNYNSHYLPSLHSLLITFHPSLLALPPSTLPHLLYHLPPFPTCSTTFHPLPLQPSTLSLYNLPLPPSTTFHPLPLQPSTLSLYNLPPTCLCASVSWTYNSLPLNPACREVGVFLGSFLTGQSEGQSMSHDTTHTRL